ncbi:MAG: plasmid pRiA4b ORF-3 family protein [Planctomycetota bacterium JB042]
MDSSSASEARTEPVLALHVSLRWIDPPVWRRIVVPAAWPLEALHEVLQIAFDWEDRHLHQFVVRGTIFSSRPVRHAANERDATRTALGEVLPLVGSELTYVYDFGDDWHHLVKLEMIGRAAPGPPRCLEGERAAPPEDCGGPPGYEQLLKALDSPEDAEDAERAAFYGPFDPEAFDAGKVDRRFAVRFARRTAATRASKPRRVTGKRAHERVLAVLEGGETVAGAAGWDELLEDVSPTVARNGCVKALESDAVPLRSGAAVNALLELVGLTDAARKKLEAIALSSERSPISRLLALDALQALDEPLADRAFEKLDAEGARAIRVAGMRRLLTTLEEGKETVDSLFGPFLELPPELHVTALEEVEEAREALGTPPATVHEPLRALGLGAAAKAWLARRILSEGRASWPAESRDVEAVCSGCDGAGTFGLTVFCRQEDGNSTLVNLVAAVDGGARGGFVAADLSPANAGRIRARILDEVAGNGAFVSPGRAVALAREVAERDERAGLPLPSEVRYALARIARLGVPDEPGPAPASAVVAPTRARVEELLRERPFESWFFTPGDQMELREEPDRLRRRLRAMVRFMARLRADLGDRERAGVLNSLAATLDEGSDPNASPLVGAMLARSPDIETEVGLRLPGDPARDMLRERIPHDPNEEPTGRHVAILDLAEATLGALDAFQIRVPSSRRIREQDYADLSIEIASACLGRRDAPDLGPLLLDRWPPLGDYAAELGEELENALRAFLDRFCTGCAVACHDHPDEPMEEVFLAEDHPSDLEEVDEDPDDDADDDVDRR